MPTQSKPVLITPHDDQLEAVEKFRDQPACLIGDEMGVGKTVTAIARDFQLRKDFDGLRERPTLIIAEKIGLDVWDYHLKAMGVPSQDILIIDPADRSEFAEELELLREIKTTPFVYFIMHLDAIRLLPLLTETRRPIIWGHIIADEVHLFKNRKAVRTKLFKKIKTDFKTGCTGTPADDKPDEIWSILNWLYPRQFRAYWKWYDNYLESEENVRHDHYVDANGMHRVKLTGYREVTGVQNVDELHEIIDPFYIRRMLLDVEPDMPMKDPVEPPIMVDLTPGQKKVYKSLAKKSLARIEDTTGAEFILLAPAMVAVYTRLQQLALATLVAEYQTYEHDYLEDEQWQDWDFPKIVLTKPSPKLDALMNMITTHEDEPFVIFTQFRGMADLVEEECKSKGISVVKIHGGVTSHKKRTELVSEFQDGTARIFVGTIAAAGKTITLTRAHHVIFTDLSWNPNRNAQAVARLWRRTQKNAVRIYRIEARDSIDQVRLEKIHSKAELINAIMNPRG